MELGLVGRDALLARGRLSAPALPASAQPADPEAGRVPGAKLYALEANGDVFESDGSTAWRYRWGSIPDPARCHVYTMSGTANGAVVYMTSAASSIAGSSGTSHVCPPLWESASGSLQPVPADQLPRDASDEGSGLLVAPDGRTVYIWRWGVGLAKSTDSGVTWARVSLPGKEVEGIVLDPGRPDHLWLEMRSGSPTQLHLYRSDNAGDSWQEVPTLGTPIAEQQMPVPMAPDPHVADGLWIGTNHGLFHTTDAGRTWEQVGGGLPRALVVDGLAVSPFDDQWILAWRQYTGLYTSHDGGRSWQRAPGTVPNESCHATFDPLDHRHIYLACYRGVSTSDDGGRTWSQDVSIGSATSVLASTGHPGLAYVVGWGHTVLDGLMRGQVFRTTNGGATWQPWAGGDMQASDTIVGIAGSVP